MARLVGVDIPDNKRGEIALTYIYGIGRSASNTILKKAGVDKNMKVQDWNDEQFGSVRQVITETMKAFDGHWLLPGYPSSYRLAGPGSVNQK
jgi:small subunit ribosomal protein S13